MQNTKVSVVDEIQYGVYRWQDKDGRYVVNQDQEYMCIASKKGDARRIDMLRKAAESYGIEDGQAVFTAGSRPISKEEWVEQVQRREAGLLPDRYDLGSLMDDYNFQKSLDK